MNVTFAAENATMSGSVNEGMFSVVGQQSYSLPLFGSYSVSYQLSGTFVTDDSWNGVFTLQFSGLDSTNSTCQNQTFTVSGNRI